MKAALEAPQDALPAHSVPIMPTVTAVRAYVPMYVPQLNAVQTQSVLRSAIRPNLNVCLAILETVTISSVAALRHAQLCIVASTHSVLSIEQTNQFANVSPALPETHGPVVVAFHIRNARLLLAWPEVNVKMEAALKNVKIANVDPVQDVTAKVVNANVNRTMS